MKRTMSGSDEVSARATTAPPMDVAAEETHLIGRILHGEKEEFRHLVNRYQNRIYALIMRQVADVSVTEELTQDAFVKAYCHLSSFKFEARFSTWLTRIALNLTNSYFASRRYKERLKTVELCSHAPNQLDEQEQNRCDRTAVEKLRKAVSLLDSKYRDVLVLCALERKPYLEAAEILDIPVGTVRSRLNKARLLLRDAYFRV